MFPWSMEREEAFIFFLRHSLHKISGADFLWKDNFHTWKLGEVSVF